ncbi:bifunctional folylpolyglutamate synthase/dihydrofolate synthase [Chitinophagaceae bacterium MMS25-I14]
MNASLSYRQTLDYLYAQLPMFSKLGKDAIKKDLTNTLKFCALLDNPQNSYKTIHIAGTNGKGSTSHALAAILQEAGYKVGLYTSPHLVDFRERIRINGVPVSEQWVVDFVAANKGHIEGIQPSFFEVTVAMAFKAFAEEQVDIAVIETGLGGRLDSTNVITPILSIITNISYDHMDVLGHTLEAIAAEKAGIIKPGVPVLIGEQREETERVFFEHAVRQGSTIYYAEALWDLVRVKQDEHFQYFKAVKNADRTIHELHTDLLGTYQYHNLRTILAASDILREQCGLAVSREHTFGALQQVKALTGLRGRWEWLQSKPVIIADVGHNPAGVKEIMKQWALVQAARKHILIGFVKDKDIKEALSLLPKDAIYYFCNAQIPRALPAKDLAEKAQEAGLQGDYYATIEDGVVAAKHQMSEDDALLITGSFFVVGEAIQALDNLKM